MINVKSDIDKLLNVRLTGDASPFRTAVRNVVAACKNSPRARGGRRNSPLGCSSRSRNAGERGGQSMLDQV